ncbi:MAG: flagellar filament capping protein FliD [Candidatus Magnetominusculus sp. LBB02]|nr:flagellar filament capping protein FliD [Candidatus Magnetominusculus sp. LBB02]
MADTTTTTTAPVNSTAAAAMAQWKPSTPPVSLTTGVESGLNTGAIITALMTAEAQPYNDLANKATSYNSQISSFGQVSSSLSALQKAVAGLTSKNLSTFNVTSSNQNVLTATASAKASPGTYSVKVNQLAQDEEIISQSYASDSSVAFATGTLTVGNGGHSTTINIDRTNNTLTGIRDAINRSATDVSASIINDGTGYRLIISTKNGGAINGLVVSGNSTGPTGTDLNDLSYDSTNPGTGPMSLLQTGSDASFTVNGLPITSHSNTLTNVLKGVTINLQSATSPSAVTLNIGQNAASSSTGLTAFVTAYNNTQTLLAQLTAQGQPLSSNMTIASIQNTIRSMTTTYFNGATSIMATFGINHLKDGTLQVDTAAMDKAVSTNLTGFNKMLDAMSNKFQTASAYGILGTILNNTITSVTRNLTTNISQIQSQETGMSEQLNHKQTALQQKYAALESTIAQLKSASGAISGSGSGSSSSSNTTPTLTTSA